MRKYISMAIPIACLGFFLAAATYNISYPGLHYDETLFANGALGDLDGSFIYKKLGVIPLFSMPYLGALATWIYWLVFKVFSVSVWSIRLPMILLGAAGVAGYYHLAQKYFGERESWMATVLLVLNPSFIFATRQWYTGLEFGIQVLVMLALFSGASGWILASTMLLGIYYKISFAWWVAGVLIAGFYAFPEKRKVLFGCAGAAGFSLLLWRWYSIFPVSAEVVVGLLPRWERVSGFLSALADGSAFFRFAINREPRGMEFGNYWLGFLTLGLSLHLYFAKKDKKLLFLLIMLLVSGGIIFLSPYAMAYWHFLPLLPFLLLLAARLLAGSGKLGLAIWALYALQLCIMQGFYFQQSKFDTEKKAWSTAIYSLISFCEEEKRICSSVDWGTHNQLLAFLGDPKRAQVFSRTTNLDAETFYVVYHEYPGQEQRQEFFASAEKNGWELVLAKQIPEGELPVYDLYRLKKAAKRQKIEINL